ncbi:MAG: hypothetical protein FJ308_24340, partial [Planctomycetes bacterium]|nr:hypothetical protein [Planctomycetota bacterium]
AASLEVDGKKVAATITKSGIYLSVKFKAEFAPNTRHTAKVIYLDVAGKPTYYEWSFATDPLNDPNPPFKQSLIKNGGFETGDFTGWTQVGDTGSRSVEDGTGCIPRRYPASGNYLSAFGNDGPGGIEQLIDTVPGSYYTVEFAFFNGPWTSEFYFQATWDGQVVFDLRKPEAAAGWRYHRYTVQATGARSKVGFVTKRAGCFNLDSIAAYQSGPNSSRYDLVEDLVTWDQAKADAEARGGHLVTITSQQEWDAIKSRLMDRLRGKITWIGATDRAQSNRWEWVTGEPFSFSRWHPNEPNGSGNVAVMGWDSPEELLWDDYGDGNSMLPYLIEWEGLPDPLKKSNVLIIEAEDFDFDGGQTIT